MATRQDHCFLCLAVNSKFASRNKADSQAVFTKAVLCRIKLILTFQMGDNLGVDYFFEHLADDWQKTYGFVILHVKCRLSYGWQFLG